MRAVFDVNVLIRLTFGSPLVARLIRAANDAAFVILVTDVLIDQLAQTARKPRPADRVDLTADNEPVAFLKEEADFVPLGRPFPACRDSDNTYLLALARDWPGGLLSHQRLGPAFAGPAWVLRNRDAGRL